MFATSLLGTVIFVDDYFNCLTVGTVMKPITDKYKITRAKLAYVIDATAAPICIIAPISSWAAAVGSSLPSGSNIDGFSLFVKAIPFNYYALLTLVFLIFLMILNADFSKMKRYEEEKGNETHDQKHEADVPVVGKGQVKDLILPILFLIASCIGFMLYTGGFFEGKDIITALSECSSGRSLVLGSFSTLIFTFLLYIPRKVVAFVDFCGSFSQGFKSMTSAIMILCLAWTLSGICGEEYLRIGQFVSRIISGNTSAAAVLPACFPGCSGPVLCHRNFLGTFGILIPISVAVVGNDISALTLLVGSILSGAVCGDHISPISDTTILASAGAGCRHIDHVATQMPYALIVAVCAVVGYLTAGALGNGFLGLAVAAGALAVAMASIVWNLKKKA